MGEYLTELLTKIEEVVLAQDERWTWLRKAEGSTGPERAVVFAPAHWCDTFPAIGTRRWDGDKDAAMDWGDTFSESGTRPKLESRWLIFAIEVWEDSCRLRFSVYPTSDQPLRQRVISRLVADPKEFGLKMSRKAGMTAEFTTLLVEKIIEWQEGEEPTPAQVAADVRMKLDEVWNRIAGVPASLRPIFDERRKSRA